MATLIDKLRQFFRLEPKAGGETAVPPPPPPFTDATLTRLMQQVAQTEEGYYTCEETFALLDEYAEMVVSGEDAAALMPLVKAHLRICPECGSHFDILRTIS
ncbi:MAG: zf-HC2 domain-containing protein [Ardenticatenaceae bacterium]|nr:zf-HC2 domain-containing protein [Ardenticatenaceae bacterium]